MTERKDVRAIARIFRKTPGWWTVKEFCAFAKEALVEINAVRARRGDWRLPDDPNATPSR